MQKLIIVRAGSSVWQEEQRLQGTVPLPLTESDKQSLCELAGVIEREQADFLYSSGNESSGSTASYLARLCGLPSRTMYDLHELDCGLWQGLRMAEIKARFPSAYRMWRSHPSHVIPPEGESLDEAGHRLRNAMKIIQKKHRGKTVVIVGAPLITGLLECVLRHLDFDTLWSVADSKQAYRVFTPERVVSHGQAGMVRHRGENHIDTLDKLSPIYRHPERQPSSYRTNTV